MKKKIGVITLTDITYLSDPSYGTDCAYNDVITTVPGEYNVYITRSESNDPFFKDRISNLIAVHKDYTKQLKHFPNNDKYDFGCGVDSGTCGVFNAEYYEKFHDDLTADDDWYDQNVMTMDDFKITDGLGAMCSSGVGDGYYPIYAEYTGTDEAYAIRIKFL
jgi:hypothetical protein